MDRTDPSSPKPIDASRTTRLQDGSHVSSDELAELVYEDLRGAAAALLQGQAQRPTLQPTALVHEAYLKLAQSDASFEDRAHFFRVAARAMRHVLIDAARGRQSQKRGGGVERVTLIEGIDGAKTQTVDVLELEEALTRLGTIKDRYVEIVELRFYGGLTFPEIASAIGVSESQIWKDWNMARSHLVLYFRDRAERG